MQKYFGLESTCVLSAELADHVRKVPLIPRFVTSWTSQSLTLPSTEDQEPSSLRYKGAVQRHTDFGSPGGQTAY